MSELARRYAKALYLSGGDEGELRRTAAALEDCPPLWEALVSPAVSPDEKQAVLRRLPVLSGQTLLTDFFQLLARKGRLALLPDILAEYHALVLEGRNAAKCVMTCVHAPDPRRQEEIKSMLCRLHHKSEVELEIRLDPSLVGGFTLEIEGITYDKSVRGQLRELTQQLQVRRMV